MSSDGEYTPDVCKITPIEAFCSTNLNNKIKAIDDLGTRILNVLGYPSVNIELHKDQLREAVSISTEMYTKYCGWTTEYLVLDSNLYKRNLGIKLDDLYTISSLKLKEENKANTEYNTRGPNKKFEVNKNFYVSKLGIAFEKYKGINSTMDKDFPDGINPFDIVSEDYYNILILLGYSEDDFKKNKNHAFTEGGAIIDFDKPDENGNFRERPTTYQNMYDYDLMDYRKVRAVREYEEGASTSITSLFSFEASMATQAYYTWQFSTKGFDLTSFYTMNEWRKNRERLLATKRDWIFDERSQYFSLSPQPKIGVRFFGVLECYVESPLRDIIKSPWVFKYALAYSKVMLGNIRGKFGSVNIPGGGAISGTDMKQEGLQEIEKLETMLTKTNGFGEARGPLFFIG